MMRSGGPTIRNESILSGGRSVTLVFDCDGEPVPAILMLPHRGDRPAAAALLLHGFSLNKENMASAFGSELLVRGIASLSIDLPLHGERYAGQFNLPNSPFEMMRRWRAAQQECRFALQFLAEQPELDRSRLSIVGYSLGSFLALKVAADEEYLKAAVLACAGDLPDYVPFAGMIRMLADPLQWVRQIAGRPLLMLHGRHDTIVHPDLADRLFKAAGEPKQMLWYNCGHILPKEAMSQAADWLASALQPDM